MPIYGPSYPKKGKKALVAKYVSKRKGYTNYRKKQLRNRTSVPVGLGFPKRMVMTHKYVEVGTLTSTAGAINKYYWSCNGMFDPNITSTGGQPLYFDQMAAIYDHYTVIGSRMKIRIVPSTATTPAFTVGMFIDDDTTSTNVSSTQALAEQSSGTLRLVPANFNDKPIVFSRKWSAKKTFGGSILGNTELQGTASANPTEQSYYVLGLSTATAADSTIIFEVEMSFIAVWDELRDIARS